jgi:hypothetical protein
MHRATNKQHSEMRERPTTTTANRTKRAEEQVFFFSTALAYTFITIINIAFFSFVWFFSCLPAPPSSTAVRVKSSLDVEEFRLEN